MRRYLGLGLLVLLSAIGLKAQSFSGTTYINFDTGGYAHYDLDFSASFVIGGDSYGSAYAGYGNLYSSSWSNIGEAGVFYSLNNIHKVGNQWVAESVWCWSFTNAGYYDTTIDYDVVVSSSGYVYGQAEYNTVEGRLSGY